MYRTVCSVESRRYFDLKRAPPRFAYICHMSAIINDAGFIDKQVNEKE